MLFFNKNKKDWTTVTDWDLAQGCVNNNRGAQEALYRRFFASMLRYCLHYTNGDESKALEILNDGFLRVFKKIYTFEGKGSLEGWVRRLIFNAIATYFESNKKYIDNVLLGDDLFVPSQNKTAEGEGFAEIFEYDWGYLQNLLPPATRQVFHLYAIEGYKHEEIATQLGISVGTSKWHFAQAKARLKEILSKNN